MVLYWFHTCVLVGVNRGFYNFVEKEVIIMFLEIVLQGLYLTWMVCLWILCYYFMVYRKMLSEIASSGIEIEHKDYVVIQVNKSIWTKILLYTNKY